MTAIVINRLHKTYPRSWASAPVDALKGVSLRVEAGEVFGFIGPNGAGKSSTIKILTGAAMPSSGEARLFDVSVTDPKARLGMGYVSENPNLPDCLTPMEVLSMSMDLHQIKVSNRRTHCMAWLERFGIERVANKPIRSFSKGMVQRTALAHALCIRPRLLILDEPLSGLDPVGRKDVVDILAEYKRNGGTVFLTSHVLHDVERLADRFALIHQGELKTVREPLQLMESEQRFFVRSIGSNPIEGMTADGASRWCGDVERQNLWPLLHRLEAFGHTLVEVKPTLNLEAVFMSYVKDGS